MSQAVEQPQHTYPQNFETTTHKIYRMVAWGFAHVGDDSGN